MPKSATDKIQKHLGTAVQVPVLGSVTLPPPEKLVFYAGLGLLVVFGVMEWPVALIIGVGHVLADRRNWLLGQAVGEALEEA